MILFEWGSRRTPFGNAFQCLPISSDSFQSLRFLPIPSQNLPIESSIRTSNAFQYFETFQIAMNLIRLNFLNETLAHRGQRERVQTANFRAYYGIEGNRPAVHWVNFWPSVPGVHTNAKCNCTRCTVSVAACASHTETYSSLPPVRRRSPSSE